MNGAALLLPSRARLRSGPALRKAPLPVIVTLLSAAVHAAVGVAVFVAASAWSASQPKTYIVNLVPAVAAVGSPQARPAPAAPRAAPPPPTPAPAPPPRPSPSELPQREPARPPAAETPRAPAPELPARREAAAEMPARSESVGLPDRPLPARPPVTPRAGERELPSVASAPGAPPPPAPARAETPVAAAPPPPAPPPGRPSGSAQGAGAVTLNVSDFPFAWYLGVIQRKITERWEGRALQGRQPVAVFEIGRDGQISKLGISKTSGNHYYDQAALRAVTEANPFPPLPAEFTEPFLRVHLGFNFAADRG